MPARRHKVRVDELRRVLVRAKGGAANDFGLESNDGGVNAVVDDGDLDRFDAATSFSVGSRLQEVGKLLYALEPWGIPAACAR